MPASYHSGDILVTAIFYLQQIIDLNKKIMQEIQSNLKSCTNAAHKNMCNNIT